MKAFGKAYENIEAASGGNFKKLPAGGYIAEIKAVEDVPAKEYLKVIYDEIECPNCGRELHEGDMVFEIRNKGNLEIIACEYCIDELSRFVEDL